MAWWKSNCFWGCCCGCDCMAGCTGIGPGIAPGTMAAPGGNCPGIITGCPGGGAEYMVGAYIPGGTLAGMTGYVAVVVGSPYVMVSWLLAGCCFFPFFFLLLELIFSPLKFPSLKNEPLQIAYIPYGADMESRLWIHSDVYEIHYFCITIFWYKRIAITDASR